MMKVAALLCAVFAAVNAGLLGVPATTLVRAPAHDSAVIKSDRIGGNFAYSSVEGHAYAAVSPIVQQVVSPVAVSYSAHQVAAPVAYHAAPAAYAYGAAPAYAYGAHHGAYAYGAYPGAYSYGAYPAHGGVVVAK